MSAAAAQVRRQDKLVASKKCNNLLYIKRAKIKADFSHNRTRGALRGELCLLLLHQVTHV